MGAARVSVDFLLPRTSEDFETLCRALFCQAWRAPDLKLFGRRGQCQSGIDMVGNAERSPGSKELVAVQTKRKRSDLQLTLSELLPDIERAKEFVPPLQHLAIATTARRSPELHRTILALSD